MIVGIGDKRFIELFEIERIHLARIIIIKKEFWFAKSAPLVRDEIEIKRRFLGLVPRNQCKSYERVSWTYIDISLVHIWTLVRASAIFSCNKQIRDWQQHRDRTWNLCAALKILQKSNYVFGIYIYMRMILKFFSDKIVRFKEEKKKETKKSKKKIGFLKLFLYINIISLTHFNDLKYDIESVWCITALSEKDSRLVFAINNSEQLITSFRANCSKNRSTLRVDLFFPVFSRWNKKK